MMQYLDEVKNLRQKQAVRRRAGEYVKCVVIGEKLRQLHRRHRNTSSINYADDLFNLAMMYEETGNLERAVKLYADSLRIIGELMGFGLEYADRLTTLGVCSVKLGELDKALEMFTQAEYIRKKRLGKEHPATADATYNVANCQYEHEMYKRALNSHERALKARSKHTGDIAYADSLNGCGYCCEALGNITEAREYFKRALEAASRIIAAESEEYLADLMYYADFLSRNNMHEEAVKHYNKCASIIKKLYTENHVSYAGVLNCAAEEYEKLGNLKKSLAVKTKAMNTLVRVLGENHLYFANYIKIIAIGYHKLGDIDSAIRMMKRSLKIKESIIGCGNENYARDMLALALFYLEKSDYKRIEDTLKYAIKRVDPDDPETPRFYLSIRELCYIAGEIARIKKDAVPAPAPAEESEDEPVSGDVSKMEALAKLFKRMGDIFDSNEL